MIEIKIPKLGLTMENAQLIRWEVGSGDEVAEGDPLLLIETDKVTFEVTAPAAGIIHLIAEAGSTCQVEETVGLLAQDREEYEQIIKEHPSAVSETPVSAEGAEPGPSRIWPTPPSGPEGRIKSSPLARSMAAQHGLDLATLKGSGPGGRIVKADVLSALEGKRSEPQKQVEESRAMPAHTMGKEAMERLPIRGVRKLISDNMYQSLKDTAQLTLHTEASAEALISLRERIRNDGKKVSYNAILMKITAAALGLHPKINASVEGNTIHVWRQIHIGLAMEANDALIVPVVRNPDQKSFREIDRDITALIHKTRENSLSPDDLSNGTFTISNLGFADIDFFTPIVRPPESAILGVGRILKKPVIKNDAVVPEHCMGLSLTFDHRIIDGAPGARFLNTITQMIEDPLRLIS